MLSAVTLTYTYMRKISNILTPDTVYTTKKTDWLLKLRFSNVFHLFRVPYFKLNFYI